MILYVSGPMRGYPNFNFPAFDAATAVLRDMGHEVHNPAEHDRGLYPDIESWPGFSSGDVVQCPAFNLSGSLAWDFQRILDSHGIVMLPGWEKSSGAKAERFLAECVGRYVFTIERGQQEDDMQSGRPYLLLDDRQMIQWPQLKEEV